MDKIKTPLSKKFWLSLVIFSLIGQVAWVVENMYLNVFIFEEFNASANSISTMVALSAISATLTTLLMGALSDKLGKRKAFMTYGYIIWGVSILGFSFITKANLGKFFDEARSITIGITLVILLDCIMTFFGSTANDACFNAWLTDVTDDSNRGKVEGINSAMPLISILVVFGSMMFVPNNSHKWTIIFTSIGLVVLISGIVGIFTIEEKPIKSNDQNYFKNIIHGFMPSVVKKNVMLYVILIAYMLFGVCIQIFMPYLIIYYQYTLQMDNYVFIMAPAIVLASIFTVVYGKVIDKKGFKFSITISLFILAIGLAFLYLFNNTILVFLGSLFMMAGYLSGGACFASIIRSKTPVGEVGSFQGVRMVSYVLLPMVIGPFIGAGIINNASNGTIIDTDGTVKTIPNSNIFLGSLITCLLIFVVLYFIFKEKPTVKMLKSRSYSLNDHPLPEYPRVNLKRESFMNLNGLWDLAIIKDFKLEDLPKVNYDTQILVPYCVESLLSRVTKKVTKDDTIIYRKTIHISDNFIKDKVILNLDGVEQFATVIVNSKVITKDIYVGYTRCSIDITSAIKANSDNEIIILVKDTFDKAYPYGKQTQTPGGMWYTAVSGIYKTVWLESVSDSYITNVKFDTDIDKAKLLVNLTSSDNSYDGDIEIYFKESLVAKECFKSNTFTINFSDINLWDNLNPNLYSVKIRNNNDYIESYFAFRLIECLDKKFYLNHKPIFFNGLLDQGYFSDGIFTPNSYDDYLYDIAQMKSLGFNTLRKHIKIEPDYFYYLCDKEGMFVWQDFVNNSKYSFFVDTALPTIGFKDLNDLKRHKGDNRKIFTLEMSKVVKSLYNFPSIVLWTIFNEGWGQFDSLSVYNELCKLDSSRLIDCNSGWFDSKCNNIKSEHVYFKKLNLKYDHRCMILSEFGGYSYKVDGHYYSSKTYGYKFFKEKIEFEDAFINLYLNEVIPEVKRGLQGAIYTQVSDVEEETNGLLTFDRCVLKVDKQKVKEVMDKLYHEYNVKNESDQ